MGVIAPAGVVAIVVSVFGALGAAPAAAGTTGSHERVPTQLLQQFPLNPQATQTASSAAGAEPLQGSARTPTAPVSKGVSKQRNADAGGGITFVWLLVLAAVTLALAATRLLQPSRGSLTRAFQRRPRLRRAVRAAPSRPQTPPTPNRPAPHPGGLGSATASKVAPPSPRAGSSKTTAPSSPAAASATAGRSVPAASTSKGAQSTGPAPATAPQPGRAARTGQRRHPVPAASMGRQPPDSEDPAAAFHCGVELERQGNLAAAELLTAAPIGTAMWPRHPARPSAGAARGRRWRGVGLPSCS